VAPDPTSAGPDAAPPPQRSLLLSRREYVAGFDRLLGLARHELRIFDPDLSELGLNSPQKIGLLQNLILRGENRILIAVHDTGHVLQRCPRLMSLLGSFYGSVLIYQTTGIAARVQDCFALADADHLVRRPVTRQPRGVLILNDPKEGFPMRDRFNEIWAHSQPTVAPSAAGL